MTWTPPRSQKKDTIISQGTGVDHKGTAGSTPLAAASAAVRPVAGCDWTAKANGAAAADSNSSRSEWLDWDDGHIPENVPAETNTKLVRDLLYHPYNSPTTTKNDPSSSPQQTTTSGAGVAVLVKDNSVDPSLLQALYETTLQKDKPWGTYVTLPQVLPEWEKLENRSSSSWPETNEMTSSSSSVLDDHATRTSRQAEHGGGGSNSSNVSPDEQLAVRVVAAFLHHATTFQQQQQQQDLQNSTSSNPAKSNNRSQQQQQQQVDSSSPPAAATGDHNSTMSSGGGGDGSNNNSFFFDKHFLRRDAHGVAIWALASNVGAQVPYHLDYAEQLRYTANIIVPPLLAGTLQCTTAAAAIQGGAYCTHTAGLSHYERHGYKGNKSSSSCDGGADGLLAQALESKTVLDGDLESHYEPATAGEGRWIRIPYRSNRMIVQSGHLPHLSTTVESIHPADDGKRVVVGFNVFGHNVGPYVQRAPEHSDTFRRKVALERLLSTCLQQQPSNKSNNNDSQEHYGKNDSSSSQNLSVQAVRANPWLAKLLVRAKRQQAKEEFEQARADLNVKIDEALRQQQQQADSSSRITVQDCMDRFARTNDDDKGWPNAVDVQVHILRGCRQGRWRVVLQTVEPQDGSSNDDDDGSSAVLRSDRELIRDCDNGNDPTTTSCSSSSSCLVSPHAYLMFAKNTTTSGIEPTTTLH